jgi:hypothetical protein
MAAESPEGGAVKRRVGPLVTCRQHSALLYQRRNEKIREKMEKLIEANRRLQ